MIASWDGVTRTSILSRELKRRTELDISWRSRTEETLAQRPGLRMMGKVLNGKFLAIISKIAMF